MKKHLGLILVLALLSNLLVLPQAHAAHINNFTFLIPYTANDLKTQFETGRTDIDATEIVTTISISVLRDGTTVYYDHWEDGLERNLTDPVQSSTEVFTRSAGEIITLQDDVPVPRPDDPTDFLYDGGDKISATGGSIAVSLAVWPEPLLSLSDPGYLYAGAWELYPTGRWCDDYVIPVGVDLASERAGFTVTGFNVQAVEDDTEVWVYDRNDNLLPGYSFPIILAEGKDFPIFSGVESGTRVDASEPVQVQLFTGDPSQIYEARAFTLLCRDEWSDEYLAPRSSDGDFWFYNDNDSDLIVDVRTAAGPQLPMTIPANGAARYPVVGDPVLADRSGALFTSTDGRHFYGLVALDANYVQDWGYALLPTDNLTTQALVGWAPGNSSTPPGSYVGPNPGQTDAGRRASRVYVTAENDTTLYVAFEGDPSNPITYTLSALQELDIVDEFPPPTPPDFDMTGAYLYTIDGEAFIAVWGQDADAPGSEPSIDVGTNIAPLRAPALQKTYLPETVGFNCGTLSQSYTFQFDLIAYNDSAIDIVDAVVQDELPPEFRYVPNSTTLDGISVPDDTSGSRFPLDGAGLNIGTLDAYGSATVSFLADTDATGEFINVGLLTPSADPAEVDVQVPTLPAGYQVTKALVDPLSGVADPGQVVTFSLTISNTGDVTITELPLEDQFDPDVLTYGSSASVPPTSVDAAAGAISWDDLVATFGDLTPTTPPWTIELSFIVVDDLPSGVTNTINRAFSTGAQGSDGAPQAITCAEALVSFDVPTPTPTPTRTSDDGDGDDDKEDPTPTPTPSITVSTPTPPPPPPAPTPAVLFLPETGIGHSGTQPTWPLLALPGLGLLVGWVVYRRRRDE